MVTIEVCNEVTDEVVRRIRSGEYALIVLNYANPDMVGHTGILAAAIAAMEAATPSPRPAEVVEPL